MRYQMLFILSALSSVALGQTDDRVNQIRAMYARSQEVLKDQTQDEAINWSVKTTVRHNEAGVGVVRYEQEYYPLHLLGACDFVRSKRYVTVQPPTSYEILYDQGQPVFYFEHCTLGDEVYEYRIYWDAEGTVCQYVPQRIEAGRKVRLDTDGIDMWMRSERAYRYAMQEYKRGTEGYETFEYGHDQSPLVAPQSREAVYRRVNQIYDAYFSRELMQEPDPEAEGEDFDGLGKMSSFVTPDFNQAYCMCCAKSVHTNELFHDYDLWTNAQDVDARGLVGIEIRDYSDTKARVAVQFWNCGTLTTTVLDLVYVPDQSLWLVDDFLQPSDASSYRARMHRFLAD